jgi:hypothetical protein
MSEDRKKFEELVDQRAEWIGGAVEELPNGSNWGSYFKGTIFDLTLGGRHHDDFFLVQTKEGVDLGGDIGHLSISERTDLFIRFSGTYGPHFTIYKPGVVDCHAKYIEAMDKAAEASKAKGMTDQELAAATALLSAKTTMVDAQNRTRDRRNEANAYEEVYPELEDAIEEELQRRGVIK